MSEQVPLGQFVNAQNSVTVPAGEKIVNSFRRATAIYYLESKRIMVAGEDFTDARKALSGLETKLFAYQREQKNKGNK